MDSYRQKIILTLEIPFIVKKQKGISPSTRVLIHRAVFILVIFDMALPLSMPKPNREGAFSRRLVSIIVCSCVSAFS